MPRRAAVFAAFSLLTLAAPRAAPAQAPPPGWTAQTVGTQAVLTPPGLKAGEFFRVILFPRASLHGTPLADYLNALTEKEVAALGTPTGDPEPSSGDSAITLTRQFLSKRGQALTAINAAYPLDGGRVRVMSILTSQDGKIFLRYRPQVLAVRKDISDQDKSAAQAGPGPDGMTPGGPIVPGIYEGDTTYRAEETIPPAHFRLYLYATGELRLFRANGDQIDAGSDSYSYDSATGKIGVSDQFGMNNYNNPARGFCFYGRDRAGKPYLYAEQNYSDSYHTATLLRYVGPTDVPSKGQKKVARQAAEAEAQRYKYVVAPGRGLRPAQVEGIWEKFVVQIYGIGGPDFVNYLLLKDGTVHEDLPVAPDELDVARSRRREPEHWGRWRRRGKDILMAWPDHPDRFEVVPGEMILPSKPGERISGRYGGASSGGSFATGGSYVFYGVTFTPDGRFNQDRSGGSSSSGLGSSLNDSSVSTTYGDDGATTSFSAPGAAGYAKTKKRGSDRAGTYAVNGYAITLHYDSGRVKRLPFYFLDKERDFIFFEGSLLRSDADHSH